MTNEPKAALSFRVMCVASERCLVVTVSCCRDGCGTLEMEEGDPRQPLLLRARQDEARLARSWQGRLCWGISAKNVDSTFFGFGEVGGVC